MEILLPNLKPDPRAIDSAHVAVSLGEILQRGGFLTFSPADLHDVYVTYTFPPIWPRHAVNVVKVDFRQHYLRGVIIFHRAYGPIGNIIECPYRSRNIHRLIFNRELTPQLDFKGPRWPWILPRRFEKSLRK